MFSGKFELNIVREFLWSKFDVDSGGELTTRRSHGALRGRGRGQGTSPEARLDGDCAAPSEARQDGKRVVQLVIICASFQNSHVKEFAEISKRIQLIKSDFFNINITKKAPLHQKVNDHVIKNKKEIPIIKKDDPNCIFYNFSKGDVIRVVRSDGDICYRLVK